MASQISRPVQILLVAVLAFAAVWFVALRPKPLEEAGTAPPAAAAKPAPAGAPAPAATPAKPSAATPASPAKATGTKTPGVRRVAAAQAQGRTVALLFWNGRSADDRAAREALRGASTSKGKVTKVVADIDDVGAYGEVTRGVTIAQSPTILVIDARRQARTIAGVTTSAEVAQVISDALRAGR